MRVLDRVPVVAEVGGGPPADRKTAADADGRPADAAGVVGGGGQARAAGQRRLRGTRAAGGLRAAEAAGGSDLSIAGAFVRKVKTATEMTTIIARLLRQPVLPGIRKHWLDTTALWLAASPAGWSKLHVLRLAEPRFRHRRGG